MPTVRAGYMNWNKIYNASDLNQYSKKGAMHSVIHTPDGTEWDLSNGWHLPRQEGWQKLKKPKGSKFTSSIDGKEHTVYRHHNYDDYIGYHAGTSKDMDQRIALAKEAFTKPNANIKSIDGCGHIAKLAYAVDDLIMLVKFAKKPDTCVFFNVPHAVAGILLHDAETKQTIFSTARTKSRQQNRHALGVHFWDYIRIRGCHTGAKYPFEYMKHAAGKVSTSNNRHIVTLKLKDLKGILSSNNRLSKLLNARLAGYEDLDSDKEITITTTLNDEELSTYNDMMMNLNDLSASVEATTFSEYNERNKIEPAYDVNGKDVNKGNKKALDVIASTTDDYSLIEIIQSIEDTEAAIARMLKASGGQITSRVIEAQNELAELKAQLPKEDEMHSINDAASSSAGMGNVRAEAYRKLIDKARDDVQNRVNIWINNNLSDLPEFMDMAIRIPINVNKDGNINERGINWAKNRMIAELAPTDIKNAIDMRSGEGKPLQGYSERVARALMNCAYGNNGTANFTNKVMPEKYKLHEIGKVWTRKELRDFGKSNMISPGDRPTYNMFIKAGDYAGALRYLQDHRTNLVYIDPKTNKKKFLRQEHYAHSADVLAEE